MKYIFVSIFLLFHTVYLRGQSVLTIIDSVNTKINNYISFSYDVVVENITDTSKITHDSGRLVVNNTYGKYDDFLFVSHIKNDTFCFVKDTLLRTIGSLILKDYNLNSLHVRLGTTQMFFRCFSHSFSNDRLLINPKKWDSLILDSIDTQFYYITMCDTLIEDSVITKNTVNAKINKSNFELLKYNYKHEYRYGVLNNVFTFSEWKSFPNKNEDIYSVFEKIRLKSNSVEYLEKHPTLQMQVDKNKTLSLDSITVIDSNEVNYKIGEFNKRYIVMYFWFQGCYYCKYVAPVIQKYHKENMRKDITYLGVDFISKNKNSFVQALKIDKYDFPKYRYKGDVKSFEINHAPTVIIYDNLKNKILEQLLGGYPDYERMFAKHINALPVD